MSGGAGFELRFVVPGEPVSKSRARFTGLGYGGGRAYTPEKTKDGELAVAWAARAAAPGLKLQGGRDEFQVEAEFHAGTRQRRDVDNMMKLVLDALNGVVWPDDRQVTRIIGEIWFNSDNPRTEIHITSRVPQGRLTAVCVGCETEYETYKSQSNVKFCSASCKAAYQTRRRQRTCKTCGVSFLVNHVNALGTYCPSCSGSFVTLNCPTCGEDFSIPQSAAGRRKYCSRKCSKRPGTSASNRSGVRTTGKRKRDA